MANIDIVARLQLRAEQFSSEIGARFAEMNTRARSAAQEVRESFGNSFAEVQKLAQTALVLPRTTSGSLDLSSEIAQLNASATMIEQRSIALRELSMAQTAAANSGRSDAEALRLGADAAAVASIAEERNAQAIRDRIGALKAVQGELNKTITSTELHTATGAQNTVSAGQQRAAMQQLGFQLNDVATSYSGGAKPMMIFAQQGGQIVQALGMMSNSTKGVLGFLGGPWGAVLTAATLVAVPLVAKLFDMNSALDTAVDKLKKSAAETETATRAQKLYAQSADGVMVAIKKQNDELKRSGETMEQTAKRALLAAADKQRDIVRIQKETQATLELARARLEADLAMSRQGGERSDLASLRLSGDATRITELTKKIDLYGQSIKRAEEAVRRAELPIDEKKVGDSLDAAAAATTRYEQALARLRGERARNVISRDQFQSSLKLEQAKRDRDIKAAQDADRKPRTVSLGDQLENEQAARLLSSAQTFRGASENTASGRTTLKGLFDEANINVDPKMVAWCAAFVNSVLATNGSVATPALRFAADQDTGIRRAAENVLSMVTGGVDRIVADVTGATVYGPLVNLVAPDLPQMIITRSNIVSWKMGGLTAGSNAWALQLNATPQMVMDTTGSLLVGTTAGTTHTIQRDGAPNGGAICQFAQAGAVVVAAAYAVDFGGVEGANSANAAFKLGKSATNRSLATSGTINASGADYAEYMTKADGCGTIAAGDVCGVDIDGKLTRHWGASISFVVKSTDPSLVGGDIWAAHINPKPEAPGPEPIAPGEAPTMPDDDAPEALATWRDAAVAHTALVIAYPAEHAAWVSDQANYETALEAWEDALETARQCVDRIAFCGQVPVNVAGDFAVGDYIVAVANGSGIKAIAVAEADITFAQYRRRIGKVWTVRDGRAWIDVQHG